MSDKCVFCGKEIEYDTYRGRAFPITYLDRMRSSTVKSYYDMAYNIVQSKDNVVTYHWYCDPLKRPIKIENTYMSTEQREALSFVYALYADYLDAKKEEKKNGLQNTSGSK